MAGMGREYAFANLRSGRSHNHQCNSHQQDLNGRIGRGTDVHSSYVGCRRQAVLRPSVEGRFPARNGIRFWWSLLALFIASFAAVPASFARSAAGTGTWRRFVPPPNASLQILVAQLRPHVQHGLQCVTFRFTGSGIHLQARVSLG